MKTNMFKTFFTKIGTWMSKTAKAYIKARGIARSIIDAIEAAILGTAIGSFIINKIKLWRARRKLKNCIIVGLKIIQEIPMVLVCMMKMVIV